MAYDPNPVLGENRRGLRWYQIIALLVITVSLLLIAIATLQSAEADREQACWTRATAYSTMLTSHLPLDDVQDEAAHQTIEECNERFPRDD